MDESFHTEILTVGAVLNQQFEILGPVEFKPPAALYAACDLLTGKNVLVKVLLPRYLLDAACIAQFQNEARALGRIHHPNVVSLLQFELMPSGEPYMVLDNLKGKRLSDILAQENPISIQRALPIFAQICDGIQAAHQENIVHRELNPSSILLVKMAGSDDFVKIMDFPSARLLQKTSADNMLVPIPHVLSADEPCYFSPEHLHLDAVDIRADIFGMGSLIYACLLGAAPFSAGQIRNSLKEHEFLLPKRFADLRPDLSLPQGLEAVVRKALERYPDDRFQSMEELKNALLFTTGSDSISKLGSLFDKARMFGEQNKRQDQS